MDYTATRKNAAATIAKSGKTVTMNVPSSTYDPVTGTSGLTTTTYQVKAVETYYTQAERLGSAIQIGDRRFMLSGLTTSGAVLPQPKTDYTLTVGTAELFIVSVAPLQPGDVQIIHEVQCRGG